MVHFYRNVFSFVPRGKVREAAIIFSGVVVISTDDDHGIRIPLAELDSSCFPVGHAGDLCNAGEKFTAKRIMEADRDTFDSFPSAYPSACTT
ncbi:MAG: hypothetical protein J5855_08575 [Mailhella sp.]|nr:hypothetical protein [Mailhella sp.]